MPIELAYAQLINLIADNNELFPPNPAFAPDLEYIIDTYSKITHVVTAELNHFSQNARRNIAAQVRSERSRNIHNPDRQRRRQHPHSSFESAAIFQTSNQSPSPNSPIKSFPTPSTPVNSNAIPYEQWKAKQPVREDEEDHVYNFDDFDVKKPALSDNEPTTSSSEQLFPPDSYIGPDIDNKEEEK